MPCPYAGLYIASASPSTTRPSGQSRTFSRYRRWLWVLRLIHTSVSGSARAMNRPTSGSANSMA